VYGLQRAFKIAGVKYLIMSLWKVNDQSTRELMIDFYQQWLIKGIDIPEAFRTAQNNMKKKYPDAPYHWAGFVLME
jgi:CHAT domain-containing protein